MSEPIRVRCPGCGAGLKIPLSKAGRTIPCPRCNAPVSAAAPAEADWRSQPPPPAPAPAPAPAPTPAPPPEPPPPTWHLSRGGETSGPYTAHQLKQLVKKGKLAPYDYVCQVGTTQWIEAGKLDWLFTTVTTGPDLPPPPPPPPPPEFREVFPYKPPLIAGLILLAFTGGALVLCLFMLAVNGPAKLGPIHFGAAGMFIYLAIAVLSLLGMGFAALAVKRSFGDSRVVVTDAGLDHSLYGAAGRVRWDAVARVTIQQEATAFLVKVYVRRGKTLWVSSGCFRSESAFDRCLMLILGGSGCDLEPVTSAHDIMMKVEGVMKQIDKYGSPAEFFHAAVTGKSW